MSARNEPGAYRVVKTSFWAGNILMRERAVVRASHPYVKQFPENFFPEGYVDFEWPEG